MEPTKKNFDKVEGLHIGDTYNGVPVQGEEPKYKQKYSINIGRVVPSTKKQETELTPEEKADQEEYQEWKKELRKNEPKNHKAKFW